jgi:hypothetical protein
MFLGWTTGLNQHGETWPRIGLYKMRPREYADILAEWLWKNEFLVNILHDTTLYAEKPCQ